jgi:ElaB/YqjD/DUF883 family membrane-anchored ribosome-binding protein
MTNNVEDATADISADLAALRSDVTRLTERISELAQHGRRAARIHFVDAVGDAQGKIVNSAANAQTQMRAVGSDIEASIERNPLMAMAIAFGIGICFGMMNRSRS